MKQKYIFTPKINSPKCWSTSEFDSILYFQNLDTFYNGRCYTFKPQQVKVPIIHPINVVIKNVWAQFNKTGKIVVYIHDDGLEFNLISEVIVTFKKEEKYWAVVVAQLVELLLLTSGILSSYPGINKMLSTNFTAENKEKRGW